MNMRNIFGIYSLFAAALVLFSAGTLCYVRAGTAPPPIRLSPEQQAVNMAERQLASRMRQTWRWQRTNPMKENIDNLFMPVFLLRELGSAHPGLVCRSCGYDYASPAAPALGCPTGGAKHLRRLLAPLRLRKGCYDKFAIWAGSLFPIGANYPPLLCWRGMVGLKKGTMRISWYEPLFDVYWLAFPSPQNDTAITWNNSKYTTWTHDGQPPEYTQLFPTHGPVMSMRWGGYGLQDGLNLWQLILRPVGFVRSGAGVTGSNLRIEGPLNWSGGAARVETFNIRKTHLHSIGIYVPGTMLLRHDSDRRSTIYYTSHGTQKSKRVWPSVREPYLAGGRRIQIRFARPGKAGGTYPQKMEIDTGATPRFVARFLAVRQVSGGFPPSPWERHYPAGLKEVESRLNTIHLIRGDASRQSPPHYYDKVELAAAVRGSVVRRRIFYNAYEAAYFADWGELARTLHAYRNLLKHGKIPFAFYIYSLECLTESTRQFAGGSQARKLARQFLLPAYKRLDPSQLAMQVSRLVDQYHYGFAIVALRALRDRAPVGSRLSQWSITVSLRLQSLIEKIRGNPVPYRQYAALNRLYYWRRFTKTNEAFCKQFSPRTTPIPVK